MPNVETGEFLSSPIKNYTRKQHAEKFGTCVSVDYVLVWTTAVNGAISIYFQFAFVNSLFFVRLKLQLMGVKCFFLSGFYWFGDVFDWYVMGDFRTLMCSESFKRETFDCDWSLLDFYELWWHNFVWNLFETPIWCWKLSQFTSFQIR